MPIARARLLSVGSALPDRVLTNAELEGMVDTTDEWIRSRTGIRERRIVEPGTPVSALIEPACRQCLERADCPPETIDGVIVATMTGDHSMPATANLIQHRLGCSRAWGMDLVNACNGFVAALATATTWIEAGRAQRLLVVGADVMSSIIDYRDRNTCVLFGDGAGAVLVEAGPVDGPGVVDLRLGSDGAYGDVLCVPSSGSARPSSPERLAAGEQFVHQDGRVVFQQAVRRMCDVAQSLLSACGLSVDDVDLLVPHQANLRIIEPIARRLGLPMERVVVNLEYVANTTAATIPLALADAQADGRLHDGSRLLMVAFGGGFAWGGCYATWG